MKDLEEINKTIEEIKECIICYNDILEEGNFIVSKRTVLAVNNKKKAQWINKIYYTHMKCGEPWDHHIEKFETYRANIKIYKSKNKNIISSEEEDKS